MHDVTAILEQFPLSMFSVLPAPLTVRAEDISLIYSPSKVTVKLENNAKDRKFMYRRLSSGTGSVFSHTQRRPEVFMLAESALHLKTTREVFSPECPCKFYKRNTEGTF